MTEAQIAANNAVVLAARNAAEQEIRERLALMKGKVLIRRKAGGRPKGGRNWDHFDPDEPRKVYVKAGTSKKLSDEAKRSGIIVSLLSYERNENGKTEEGSEVAEGGGAANPAPPREEV